MPRRKAPTQDSQFWYKDAVIYQLHVKTFFDSNGDGMGDFKGLIQKLPYLKNLGVTALWLLPFYPSPLKDDGYDIADYFRIHPQYGTLKDFKELLKEAHELDLKIITELVINHTSDQHPWFQRSRRSPPGSPWRNFYVWNDTPNKYQDARIIFKDFETSNWTFDPVAKAYYWHRFYAHQPDLNFDNPLVEKHIFEVLEFWLDMGVDGLRLDAVPYLFEREDTNCENLPETYALLKKLRAHVDKKYDSRMLLAEANQWPEDAVKYLGQGDACHMIFHFPLMTRLFMAMQREDSFPVIDILEQTPAIPESCQWATFLRNHDELTLEMVTDEERDYMYKFFARDPQARINLGIRRRLAPLLQNNRRKIEVLNILLYSLPGAPIIYYGDELGMGDNYFLGDRNGVRTPMQWSSSRNAGFSSANPQQLYLPVVIDPQYHYESVNVETEEASLSSLLWWMRRVLSIRKKYKSFSSGSLKFLSNDNPKILSFVRQYQDESVLVVINLSRFSQNVQVELPGFSGLTPREVFSQNKFPVIKDAPYFFTMGPYDHFWFTLHKTEERSGLPLKYVCPQLKVDDWRVISEYQTDLETTLPAYLAQVPWFQTKIKTIKEAKISDVAWVEEDRNAYAVLFIDVAYSEGTMDSYMLPLGHRSLDKAKPVSEENPHAIVATILNDKEGVLYDASYSDKFRMLWLHLFRTKKKIKTQKGELEIFSDREFHQVNQGKSVRKSERCKNDYNDVVFSYGKQYVIKFYRHPEEGPHPEIEIVEALGNQKRFEHIPEYLGKIEYRREKFEPKAISLAETFVPHKSNLFQLVLEHLEHFFEKALVNLDKARELECPKSFLDVRLESIPKPMLEMVGSFEVEMIRILGQRTGEMHLSFSALLDKDFIPEPFSLLYQRAIYQNMNTSTKSVLQLLGGPKKWPVHIRQEAQEFLQGYSDIKTCYSNILKRKIQTLKIRVHGNFHLGQILFTGKDFFFTDFKGDANRPLSERRLKRSALRDVATLINSFHYSAYRILLKHSSLRPDLYDQLKRWLDLWHTYICGIFMVSYKETILDSKLIPAEESDQRALLQAFLLDKTIVDFGYHLISSTGKAVIPLRVIKDHLRALRSG